MSTGGTWESSGRRTKRVSRAARRRALSRAQFSDPLVSRDTTPPETTIDSGPSGSANSASASFSSSEANSSYECSLDGGEFVACASPRAYAILADGPHEFMVRATDAAGNTDPSPARQSWTVDTKAPTVGSTAPADGATGVAGTANVEANFSEAMDASSLNGRTFTLTKLGDTMPVAASVSYEGSARKATLDPAQDLESNATYTATIEGGSER